MSAVSTVNSSPSAQPAALPGALNFMQKCNQAHAPKLRVSGQDQAMSNSRSDSKFSKLTSWASGKSHLFLCLAAMAIGGIAAGIIGAVFFSLPVLAVGGVALGACAFGLYKLDMFKGR